MTSLFLLIKMLILQQCKSETSVMCCVYAPLSFQMLPTSCYVFSFYSTVPNPQQLIEAKLDINMYST